MLIKPISADIVTKDGNGYKLPNILLNNPTGLETAFQINYTSDKAADHDVGLAIDLTDTGSPGVSYLIRGTVGGSSQRFYVLDNGTAYFNGAITTPSIVYTSNISPPAAVTQTINWGHTYSSADVAINMLNSVTFTNSSGQSAGVSITPILTQTGSAAMTDLLINRDESGGVGSGNQYLIDAQVDGTSKFSVSNTGAVDFAGSSYSAGDPSTTGYFVAKIAGVDYKIPVVAV